MSQFRPAKKRAEVSVDEPVCIIRELQGLSQSELSRRCGTPRQLSPPLRTIAFAWGSSVQRFGARVALSSGSLSVSKLGASG